MKYVMFTNRKTGVRQPVLSSNFISHSDLRAGEEWVPTSAGFFDVLTMRASDESESLRLAPEADDTEIVKMALAGVLESMAFVSQDLEGDLFRLAAVEKARSK